MMSAPPCKPSARENAAPNRAEQPSAPPKPPRSAFMCFTDARKKEILSKPNNATDKEELLKLVADEWRALSARDRASWDEVARNDKVRFVQEKAEYKGPWNIPKRRAKKHPLAPKRPMSAFLKYSQKRRATVKDSNPDMSNTDVSRLLGEMWRSASQAERAPYVEQEERERAQYKEDIKNWRNTQAKLDASSRTSHQQVQNVDTPPPAPKKRRDYDNGMFRHNAVDSQEASGAASMEKHVDHRIFRPYSGSGHPVESKYYSNDHHRSYASHPHPESDRGLPVKLEPQSLRSYKALEPRSYKTLESRYYPAGPHDRAGTGSPTMMHHSSRQHPQQYGATNPPTQPQRENPHATQPRFPSSDSIQFDSFGDPEPPFNPRQTRPSSSHYFPDNYYHYP